MDCILAFSCYLVISLSQIISLADIRKDFSSLISEAF
jgi:hypothetical protein